MSRDVSNRSSIRIRVLLAAEVIIDGQPIPIRIRNVSRSGLAGDARKPPKVGAAVLFRRGATERLGKVVWANGQQFGIRFSLALDDDELRLHFPQPEKARTAEAHQPSLTWESSQAVEYGRLWRDPDARLDRVQACMEVMSSEGISLGFVDEVQDTGITIVPHGEHRSSKLFITARCISSVGNSLQLCLRAEELGIG
jgi:hypothetical protein